MPGRVAAWPYIGGGLIVVGSLADVALAVYGLQGHLDPRLFVDYLGGTRHGLAALVRIGLVLLLLGSSAGPASLSRTAVNHTGFAAASLGLLGTISWAGHAGAAGLGPTLAGVVHLAAAAAWGGSLVYLAVMPSQSGQWLARAARRLSTVGAVSVALLIGTGVYAAFVHLWGPDALTRTPYGHTLLYKAAFAGLVWATAAVNRWRLLPALARGGAERGFIRGVRIESVLLLGVFGLTGALTTQPPPERAEIRQPIAFEQQVGEWTVQGRMDPATGGFEIALRIGAPGDRVPAPYEVLVVAEMIGHPMAPVHVSMRQVAAGAFRGRAVLTMAGPWLISIALPGGTAEIELLAPRVDSYR
jgi:putative copper export protein